MKRVILYLIVTFVALSTAEAGGPWTQKKGKGYFKISEWWLVFDEHYTSKGLSDPNVTNGIYSTFFYGEYGITDRVTTTLNTALFTRNVVNNVLSQTTGDVVTAGEAINNIGDADVSVKYSLTKPGAKFPVALSAVFGLPLGQSVGGVLNNLQTGDGEFNQILQLDAGRGFKLGSKVNAYSAMYLGVNNRTKGFSEELRYGAEFGVGLFGGKSWVVVKITGVDSFKNGFTAASSTTGGVFANNSEYTSYAFEWNQYISKRWGISASVASAFRGEIIAAANSYSVGVFFDTSK